MKNYCYKHVIIHFKHSIDVKFELSSLKVCKRMQNDQKVFLKGVKITKSPVIQQRLQTVTGECQMVTGGCQRVTGGCPRITEGCQMITGGYQMVTGWCEMVTEG